MSPIEVISSNRMELLALRFASDVKTPAEGAGLFEQEVVLVDNPVLGQWLGIQLAQAHGIAANMDFVQPSSLLWSLARALLGSSLPRETPLLKGESTWRLFALLQQEEVLSNKVMLPVRAYLEGGSSHYLALKRFQLAVSIADLFEQYQIFRPDWVLAWQEGKLKSRKDQVTEAWQQLLWQRLVQGVAGNGNDITQVMHRAAMEVKLVQLLSGKPENRLPFRRLSVFGLSSLSPQLLNLLDRLAGHVPVRIYLINPCQEYWGVITSSRAAGRASEEERPYLEIGNPLLASQGRQIQELIDTLHSCQEDAQFEEPGCDSLLHAIQQEILDLTYQGKSGVGVDYVDGGSCQPLPANDRNESRLPSVLIHQCHSRLREVEVMHDQLRRLLAENPGWSPRDIVVMMPKVADYLPYIEAVFSSVAEERRIPFHLNDRTLQEESPLLDSVVSLLHLSDSRLPLSEVLALLEVPAIQRKFRIDSDGFVQLRDLLQQAGARWGIDAAHRESLGLPPFGEYSWQFAIDRLMAGFAMAVPFGEESDFLLPMEGNYQVLPMPGIEGGRAALLDGFLSFWNALCRFREAQKKELSLEEWYQLLMGLLQDFYEAKEEDELQALAAVRELLLGLKKASDKEWCRLSGAVLQLDISVIRELVKPLLASSGRSGNPWREGVKFCSLMPMRAVPFKAVYIMGMGMEDYPRKSVKKSIDLMRHHHRAGDRARSMDDRWLFLEALLSARESFQVSYIARDMHRNERCEPSVVLAEFIDYLKNGHALDATDSDGKKLLQFLTVEHKLQPFSPNYFRKEEQSRLFSYNRQAWQVAVARSGSAVSEGSTNRWVKPSGVEEPELLDVSLDEFVKFFTKPWDWYFSHRVAIDFEAETIDQDDDEPYLSGSGLDAWKVKNELLEKVNSSGEDFAPLLQGFVAERKAAAAWPLGVAAEGEEVALAAGEEFFLASRALEKIPFSFTAEFSPAENTKLRIHGSLPLINSSGCLKIHHHTPSKQGAEKDLDQQIRLAVARNADKGQGASISGSRVIYYNKTVEILLDDAETGSNGERLDELFRWLCSSFIQWHATGLPCDIALLEKLANPDISNNDLDELLDEYWYGGDYKSAASDDRKKLLYFTGMEALKQPQFRCVMSGLANKVKNLEPKKVEE